MNIANLTTYGCFGDGEMYKLNKSADLSKVQRWVKFEDIEEASLNSLQQLRAEIAAAVDKFESCDQEHRMPATFSLLDRLRQLSAA